MQPMTSQRFATSRQQQYWAEAAHARLVASTKTSRSDAGTGVGTGARRLVATVAGFVHAAAH
jgi:hypothetical protein